MSFAEDLKLFLPKYLSDISYNKLINELKIFPENNDKYYFFYNENSILQGDCLNIFFEEFKTQKKIIVVSNTCDISLENDRIFTPNLLYCPLIKLNDYLNKIKEKSHCLSEKLLNEKVLSLKNSIEKQKISSIIFFSKSKFSGLENKLEDDYIAILDRISYIPLNKINIDKIKEYRMFSLGNYGFYLFLFKLSIHFTRIFERIDRV